MGFYCLLLCIFFVFYSHHSILECYNLFSGVEFSMRSFFLILEKMKFSEHETTEMTMSILSNVSFW